MPIPDPPPSEGESARRLAYRRAFGEVIRSAREECGFSQERLAELAEVSRPTIARIEGASHMITLDRLWALAAALGLSATDVIEQTEQRVAASSQNT